MSRLRLFFAWLVLAAIPLQGVAAASMLFCGAGKATGVHVATMLEQQEHHTAAGHQAHDHGHGHGAGGHAHHAHAAASDAQPEGQASASQLPDIQHKCSVCATCSHGVALSVFPHWPTLAPLPQASWHTLSVRVAAVPVLLPDKPPRA